MSFTPYSLDAGLRTERQRLKHLTAELRACERRIASLLKRKATRQRKTRQTGEQP